MILYREERAAWSDAQKTQKQVDIELEKVRAEAEEKRRADEIRIAQIEADKELGLKELELKAQQNQASASLAGTPPPPNKDAKSLKLPSFTTNSSFRTNWAATCYALNATLRMPVQRRTCGLVS